MGQDDVFRLLEKSKKPICATDICGKLKKSRSCINHSLNKLLKRNEITRKEAVLTRRIKGIDVDFRGYIYEALK